MKRGVRSVFGKILMNGKAELLNFRHKKVPPPIKESGT